MCDLPHREETTQTRSKKKEKSNFSCKLNSQTGSLHTFRTDQAQTQKLRDVQHNSDFTKSSLFISGNPMALSSI